MIAYLTAGDPNPEATPGLVAALERGGADLIELGVPFSDPIADGPIIQQAGDRAIRAGTTLARVLEIAAKIREHSEIPLLLFTYLNPALIVLADYKPAVAAGPIIVAPVNPDGGRFGSPNPQRTPAQDATLTIKLGTGERKFTGKAAEELKGLLDSRLLG